MEVRKTCKRRMWAVITVVLLLIVGIGVMLTASAETQWDTVKVVYQSGDVTGDGAINGKDLTRLNKYIAGTAELSSVAAGDVTSDGAVNAKDLTRLKKYLAGTAELDKVEMTVAVEDVFYLIMDGSEYCIVECKGNYTAVTIPKSYQGVAITKIRAGAFSKCTAITDVYYEGTAEDWANVDVASDNDPLQSATMHFAEETTYTVTFVDYDGTVLKIQTVRSGENATAPIEPFRSEYTFVGWDVPFDNIEGDLTITAQYELAARGPAFVVDSVKTVSGSENVEVKIAVKNNPGISSIGMAVSFDSALALTSVEYNSEIGGQSVQPASMLSPTRLTWISPFADVEGDWTFVVLRFAVSDTASGELPITLTYDPDNVYDMTENNISFDIINGAVIVE